MIVTAVVVTYNRRVLLERCLLALSSQSQPPDHVLVIDNASSDGTSDWLSQWLPTHVPNGSVVRLGENLGGAGGFAIGLRHAVASGADWAWMMDDDAEPHRDALQRLLDRELDPANIYGSVATQGAQLSWPMTPTDIPAGDGLHHVDELPDEIAVQFVPFLGALISSKLAAEIGFPDPGFFIAADDVDYCMRARQHGAKVLLVGASRIEHPISQRYRFWLPGRKFYSLRLPPWKRYYDVRNRIFVARAHYGLALYYSTIPGSILRLLATLWHEERRWQQIKAFYAGMIDGLMGRTGRRHQNWGLNA